MADNQGQGWHGDSQGHAEAGSQSSGNKNAAENLDENARSKGGQMAHENGAHEFSSEEARDAGQKGGSQ